jgi:hypothetical protein
MSVDIDTINKFAGKLIEILQLELKKGNKIDETFEVDWPFPNAIMIFVEKPFITSILRHLQDITFNNVNDPHYWKAEYVDLNNKMGLCCKFDGPSFESL